MVRARAQVEVAVSSGANVLVTGRDVESLAEIAETIHYQRYPKGNVALWRVDIETAMPSEWQRALGGLLRNDGPGTLLAGSIDHLAAEQQVELLTAMAADTWHAQVLATQVDNGGVAACGMSDELAAAVSTIAIDVPRLTDRPEDIPPLVDWHLDRLNRDADEAIACVSSEVLDMLMIYSWPGETHELGDVLATAHRRARGAAITARDLPKVLHLAVGHAAGRHERPEPIDLDDYLSRVESLLVERALELAGGNKAEAARLLGVSRPRLYRKLEQMGAVEPARPQPKPDAVSRPPVEFEAEPAPSSGEDIEFLPVDGDE